MSTDENKILIDRDVLQKIIDAATAGDSAASGYLDDEEVEALRAGAVLLGLDPLKVTPANFVCKYAGHHEWRPLNPLHKERARTCKHCRYTEVMPEGAGDCTCNPLLWPHKMDPACPQRRMSSHTSLEGSSGG